MLIAVFDVLDVKWISAKICSSWERVRSGDKLKLPGSMWRSCNGLETSPVVAEVKVSES